MKPINPATGNKSGLWIRSFQKTVSDLEVKMKKQMILVTIVAAVGLLASVCLAATPTVSVYFDEALTVQAMDRTDPGKVTLYIVAEGFNAKINAIEYKIDLPAGMTWIADVDMPVIRIGSTKEGIAQAWSEPIDGHSRQVIGKVLTRWDPEAGSGGDVAVLPNPISGRIRATTAGDHRVIEATGTVATVRASGVVRPTEPMLYGGHPNPFNPVTQVTFWIPETARTSVTVYDVAGKRVATLVDEVRNRGDHTVEWNAGGLSSGVYFLRLEVVDFVQNKKVVLLK
jgi:hypothetical protein